MEAGTFPRARAHIFPCAGEALVSLEADRMQGRPTSLMLQRSLGDLSGQKEQKECDEQSLLGRQVGGRLESVTNRSNATNGLLSTQAGCCLSETGAPCRSESAVPICCPELGSRPSCSVISPSTSTATILGRWAESLPDHALCSHNRSRRVQIKMSQQETHPRVGITTWPLLTARTARHVPFVAWRSATARLKAC